jgi:F0F1-type ATP synthase membrane subunit c/vacuolar-type H+-ATPase subunit K
MVNDRLRFKPLADAVTNGHADLGACLAQPVAATDARHAVADRPHLFGKMPCS